MNSSSRNLSLIVIGALLVGLLMWWMLNYNAAYSWLETYHPQKEQPYDTRVIAELLKRSRQESEFRFIEDSLLAEINELPEKTWSYVFIGQRPYLDSTEIAWLTQFIESGNTALIIANSPPELLMDQVIEIGQEQEQEQEQGQGQGQGQEYELEEMEVWEDVDFEPVYFPKMGAVIDSSVTVTLSKSGSVKSWNYFWVRDNQFTVGKWNYFDPSLTLRSGEKPLALGSLNGEFSNFIEIPLGKGRLLLHSNPVLFSNFHLLDSSHFNYAALVMDELSGTAIIWDEYNRKFRFDGPDQDNRGSGYSPQEGLLSFILSERSLRWAWFSLLGAGLLYLFFGMKRRQNPIPVIHSLPNTSIKFAETLGQLYPGKADHRRLCMLKWRLFLDHVRDQFNIPTQFRNEEERNNLIKRISIRSGIDESEIRELFDQYRQITIIYQVKDEHLHEFHVKLNTFYLQSK